MSYTCQVIEAETWAGARVSGILHELAAAGLIVLADTGYTGAGDRDRGA